MVRDRIGGIPRTQNGHLGIVPDGLSVFYDYVSMPCRSLDTARWVAYSLRVASFVAEVSHRYRAYQSNTAQHYGAAQQAYRQDRRDERARPPCRQA